MASSKARKSDEGSQTFEPVYSTDDRKRILAAFKAKPGFNADRFFHELDCHAIYYRHLNEALKREPEIAPSTLARNWSGLAKTFSAAEKALRVANEAVTTMTTNVRRLADLEAAAEDCARGDGKMQGFEPWKFELPPLPHQTDSDKADEVLVWPADKKINQVIADLAWIHRVVQQAQERATWERTTRERFNPARHRPGGKARHRPGGKAAGRRPDDVRHRFVVAIDGLYRANARDPKNPRTADRARDNTKVGELIDLLGACLGPLGIILDPNALYSLWRSATTRA